MHRETEEGTFAPWRLFISDEEFCWQQSWFADGKTQECLGMVGVVRFLMGGATYHAHTLVLTPALTHAHTIHACEYSQVCNHASTHMHTHVDTHTACTFFKWAHINISILVSDSPWLPLPLPPHDGPVTSPISAWLLALRREVSSVFFLL